MSIILNSELAKPTQLKKLQKLIIINNWAIHNVFRYKNRNDFIAAVKNQYGQDIRVQWIEDIWLNRKNLGRNFVTLANQSNIGKEIEKFKTKGFIWIIGIGGLPLQDHRKGIPKNLRWWLYKRTEIRFHPTKNSYTFSPRVPINPIDTFEMADSPEEEKEEFYLSGKFSRQQLLDILNGKLH